MQTNFLVVNVQGDQDANENLGELARRLESAEILLPPFQKARAGAWGKKKKEEYIKTIKSLSNGAVKPIGTFVIFRTTDDKFSRYYLLDGQQRLTTLVEYMGRDGLLLSIVNHISCPVQYRLYSSMPEAADWFQKINMGTSLSSYEFNMVPLTVIQDYEQNIKPQIDSIHRTMDRLHARFKIKAPGRLTDHKYKRHDLQTFYLFLTGELRSEWANNKTQERKTPERRLVEWLKSNKSELAIQVQKFDNRIENCAALIESLCSKTIGITAIRNLISMDIWARLYNGYSVEDVSKFCIKAIEKIDNAGPGRIQLENGAYMTLALGSDISLMLRFAKSYGLDIIDKKQRDKHPVAKSGYQMHHPKPFSIYGEGTTVEIPALLNMSYGNKE